MFNSLSKKPESHTCVLVSGAHARLLSNGYWPYTCSAQLRRGPRSGDSARRSSYLRDQKTRIIPTRLERAFTLAKNQWNSRHRDMYKNHAAEVGFSIRVFLECLGEVCLATFNWKTRMRERFRFFDAKCKLALYSPSSYIYVVLTCIFKIAHSISIPIHQISMIIACLIHFHYKQHIHVGQYLCL